MKRFFQSMRFQLTIVLLLFVIFNVTFITSIVMKSVATNTVEIETKRLSVISSQIADRFNKMYSSEYVSRNFASMKESEQNLYITLFLKPVFQDYFASFTSSFPDLEFGYYIPFLDSKASYNGNATYTLDNKITVVSSIKTLDDRTGYVFVDEPYTTVLKPVKQMQEDINRVTLYSIIALALAVFLIISFFTYKIILIRRGLKKLESNLDFRFPNYGGEIGDIALSVNSMAESLEKSINEMKRTESLRNLGMFTAGVVHEVRNPLTSIKGFSQILMKKLQGKEEERYVKPILTESERLENIVNDLLKYGKPAELQKTHINLRPFFDHIVEMAKQYASQRKIQFDIICGDFQISADEKKLEELFLNLFINGIQAMGEEGTLSLRCEQSGDMVLIKVSDTGVGLSDDEMKNIFVPFYTTKAEGTGLGLAIVDRVVSEHGGRIEVSSHKGEGTTFAIYLPRGE
ncbi:MAG: ATP-binding protein [Caldisericaceae bacterium]